MELVNERFHLAPTHTAGRLSINGEPFCNLLEDPVRDVNRSGRFDNGEKKIYGNTAIPYGRYKVVMDYSPRFKRVLPHILDVPEFDGVRIHRGNSSKDTLGCPLTGIIKNPKADWIEQSTVWETKLCERLNEAIKKNEEIYITFK